MAPLALGGPRRYARSWRLPVPISRLKVKTLAIIFDEGQDTGPDNFGLAVLDNIDVNGTLVGHGPQGHDTDGGGKGKGHDDEGRRER